MKRPKWPEVRNKRASISRADLQGIFARELQAPREASCECAPPQVFYAERTFGGPNWQVGYAPECPDKCHERIAEAAARLGEQYDLRAD
jgi:hypothetical protein